MKKTFESWLQDYFIGLREVGGVPIIKDNCEDLFESWLENKDIQEIIDLGDEYMKDTLEQLRQIVQKYTDPKPEYDGIVFDTILSKLK